MSVISPSHWAVGHRDALHVDTVAFVAGGYGVLEAAGLVGTGTSFLVVAGALDDAWRWGFAELDVGVLRDCASSYEDHPR